MEADRKEKSMDGKATGCCHCGHNRRKERSDYCASCEHELWTDDEVLTLDVLRRELGEPYYDGVKSPGSTVNRKQWHVCDGKEMIWLESRRRWPVWRWQELHTLGQLRRILSVIKEQSE